MGKDARKKQLILTQIRPVQNIGFVNEAFGRGSNGEESRVQNTNVQIRWFT